MNMTIGERIKKERTKLKLSQEHIAKAIGSTKQAIYKYENGIVTNIPTDKVQKMAEIFGVSPAYLMGWEENDDFALLQLFAARPVKTKRLPMLGNVACGEPIFTNEEHDSFVDADEDLHADFCLKAQGDSMINARIFDGDTLFVRRQPSVDNGEIAVILIDDDATVKRVFYDRENNVLTLMPENPTHRPMRYTGETLDHIKILGKVVSGQYRT